MKKIRIIRRSGKATSEEMHRQDELRRQVERELPELERRDQMRFSAQREESREGAVRRSIHASVVPLTRIAADAGLDLLTLDEFLTGERILDDGVLDRLAEVAATGIRRVGTSTEAGDAFLSGFRRYARGTPASRAICRSFVARVLEATGALPEPSLPQSRGEPPYLVYRPSEAPNFALIETIDTRKANVVVSLYGEPQNFPSPEYARLHVRGRARRGYSKIAIRSALDLEQGVELTRVAYELKRRRETRAG